MVHDIMSEKTTTLILLWEPHICYCGSISVMKQQFVVIPWYIVLEETEKNLADG